MTTELENERRNVNWLGVIAVLSVIGAVYLADRSGSSVGIDTAVIVALVGLASSCAAGIAVRRTRQSAADPGTPPPWAPLIATHDALEGRP